MRSTTIAARMASTHCGMRRILKRQPSPVQYLKWAIQSGTYLDRDAPPPISRVYDSSGARVQVQPYPKEYEILSMNPPIPDPPKISVRMQRKMAKENKTSASPLQPLVQAFMRRYDARTRSSAPVTNAQREDYYYNKLLGVDRPASMAFDSAMGRKAAVLNQAYEFALRQYEIIEKSGGRMTEEASIKAVEQILAEEERKEKITVRQNVLEVAAWREENIIKASKDTGASPTSTKAKDTRNKQTQKAPPLHTVPSILYSKPRTIRALNIWTQRLKAVPYDQWTLGAATALDHWIAVDVLGMTDESWLKLLDGDLETDVEQADGSVQVGNRARAYDIVTVRGYLFPETLVTTTTLDQEEEEEVEPSTNHSMTPEEEATNRSIDELLASLGGIDTKEEEKESDKSEITNDQLLEQMVDRLQEWRVKHAEIEYSNWDNKTKKEFNVWMESYINLVRTDSDPDEIDLEATREALLSEPPLARNDLSFWSKIRDETEAEILLHDLKNKADFTQSRPSETPSEKKIRQILEVFMHLPHRVQLQKLVNLGSLRPILDDFATDSDRDKFFSRYGEMLLEGLEIEHLVEDPEGTITPDDVGSDILLRNEQVNKDTRFSVKMIPYGTDEYGTSRSERARSLYRAWNMHKSGRAQYEEYLFKKGKIGLRK